MEIRVSGSFLKCQDFFFCSFNPALIRGGAEETSGGVTLITGWLATMSPEDDCVEIFTE